MFVIYVKQETSNPQISFGTLQQHVSEAHSIAVRSASPDKFHKSHGGVSDHWARTSRRMKAISIVPLELLGAATVPPWQDEEDEETQERRVRSRRKLKPISGNHASSIYGASHVANWNKYHRDTWHYCATDNYGPVYWRWLHQSLTSHYILWSTRKRITETERNWTSCTSSCALRRKPMRRVSEDRYSGLLEMSGCRISGNS